jgi:integrase/recombinase XerD
MTTELFPKTRALVARCEFPEELADFAGWLEAEHYTAQVIHRYLLRLKHVLARMRAARPGAAYTVAQLQAAFGAERSPRSRFHCFRATQRAYQRFLLIHGRLRDPQAEEDRFAVLRRNYDQHLLELRGLSLSSRQHHAITVADFLARALGPRRQLSTVTRTDVERFIALRSREISRHSLQSTVAHVRAFLRYCHERGYVQSRLDSIDTPRTYRGELPPRAVPWARVQALLASIDRHSKGGWRDYCILHLIAHYGLRPSEVVSLRLDSIDWEAAVLRVTQRKTGSELLLPLAAPTLRILRRYLKHDRHRQGAAHPELFLRARCPNGPLERTAIGDIFGETRAGGQVRV